jgi:hypothetical protein
MFFILSIIPGFLTTSLAFCCSSFVKNFVKESNISCLTDDVFGDVVDVVDVVDDVVDDGDDGDDVVDDGDDVVDVGDDEDEFVFQGHQLPSLLFLLSFF